MTYAQYQYTGKSHPVNKNQLIQSVFDAIDEFENEPDDQNILNPYQEPVVVKLTDGKIIQVPSEIQNEAIEKWARRNENNIYVAENGDPLDDTMDRPIHSNKPSPSQLIEKYDDRTTDGDNLKYIILVAVVAITVYALAKK